MGRVTGEGMISISHWGMFGVEPPRMIVPEGFFDEDELRWALTRPGIAVRTIRASPLRGVEIA